VAIGNPRMTPQTLAVLQAMLDEPSNACYGLVIARQTGLKTGTLHPILARLQQAGWVTSEWEDAASHENQGRPRRRYYQLTGEGERAAQRAVAAATSASGLPDLRPQPGY
jgi:PadR family transcriptional regulator, regulatory protein PadR